MHPLNPCHLGDEFWYISSQWAGNSINWTYVTHVILMITLGILFLVDKQFD